MDISFPGCVLAISDSDCVIVLEIKNLGLSVGLGICNG